MRRAGLGVAETFTALSDECYDSRTVRGMPMHYEGSIVVPNGIVVESMSPKESRGAPPPSKSPSNSPSTRLHASPYLSSSSELLSRRSLASPFSWPAALQSVRPRLCSRFHPWQRLSSNSSNSGFHSNSSSRSSSRRNRHSRSSDLHPLLPPCRPPRSR